MAKKKQPKTMAELTKDFEEFMKGKENNPEAEKQFEQLAKKMVIKKHKPKAGGK